MEPQLNCTYSKTKLYFRSEERKTLSKYRNIVGKQNLLRPPQWSILIPLSQIQSSVKVRTAVKNRVPSQHLKAAFSQQWARERGGCIFWPGNKISLKWRTFKEHLIDMQDLYYSITWQIFTFPLRNQFNSQEKVFSFQGHFYWTSFELCCLAGSNTKQDQKK